MSDEAVEEYSEIWGKRYVKYIDDEVIKRIKKNREMGIEYVFAEMYKNELFNEGYEKGYKMGLEIAKNKDIEAVIKEMIKSGLKTDFISKVTHLPIERIEKLREAYS